MVETRKLVAILAADVVGYSRLAGSDEDRTLARLRALRSDLIDPTIAVHNGRVVKRTGDGSIVEFRSVVDAVRCAIEVQNGMLERNAGLSPDRRIEFRVGIHVGDVVEESDGDLMGDGVNIAARLEGIAKPGAICLSEDAYRQVKARLDLAVSDLGAVQLKNIVERVRVYSVQVGDPTKAKPTQPVAPKQRSIAALLGAVVVLLPGLRVALGISLTPIGPHHTHLPRGNLGTFPSWCFRSRTCRVIKARTISPMGLQRTLRLTCRVSAIPSSSHATPLLRLRAKTSLSKKSARNLVCATCSKVPCSATKIMCASTRN